MFAHFLTFLTFCTFAFSSPIEQRRTAPTVVLIPGAWHLKTAMTGLSTELQKLGIPTDLFGLVTVNNASATIGDDTAAMVNQALSPLINTQHKDVIVYIHSYAGFPGSVAIGGLSKAERTSKGLKGGIVGIIYQSAFVPLAGQTLLGAVGGMAPMWWKTETNGFIDAINPISDFYNNETAAVAQAAVKNYVREQSAKSFNTASAQPHYGDAAYDGKRFYIHTTYDNALPMVAQQAFVANSGVKWTEYTLDWDHSPFLGEPAAVAQLINTIQKKCQ